MNGYYHWISWNAAADNGRIYGMGRDITERKHGEEKLTACDRHDSHAGLVQSAQTALMNSSIRIGMSIRVFRLKNRMAGAGRLPSIRRTCRI